LALSPNDPEMVDLLAKISDLEKKESPANRPASGPVSEGETRAPAPPAPEPAPKIPQEPPKEQLEEPVAESSHEETVVELPQDLFEEVQNSLPEPPVEPVPEPLPEESVTAGPEPPAPEPEPAVAQEEVPLPEPVHPADSGVLDETAGLASGGMPQTETMGDLLFDQGHTEKALSVYQNVLQRDPDSKALQEKIRAAKMILRMMPEEAASGPPVPPPAPTPEPEPVPEELPREPEPALLAEEKPAVPERILERVSSRMGRDLLGYVLSTRDGLPVESTDAGRWADVLAAEGMEFVRSVGDAARMLDWGEFRGTVVWMDRAILYGVPIEESRGLFLVLKPESNIGLCRLLVQEAFESVESDGEQR
jgi:predicted regulator of Ras-like GTPase activity (Roadblock/LC7/MglB family)